MAQGEFVSARGCGRSVRRNGSVSVTGSGSGESDENAAGWVDGGEILRILKCKGKQVKGSDNGRDGSYAHSHVGRRGRECGSHWEQVL